MSSAEQVKLTGPACAAVVQSLEASSSNIILPKYVYIKDKNGRYLAQRSGPSYGTLTFRSGDPDLNCAFEAINTAPSFYRFNAYGDKPVMRYYKGWYSSDGPSSKPSYNIIHASGNKVYLKDNYVVPMFFSNELNDWGAPVGRSFINSSSLMEIEQASIKNEIRIIKYIISTGKVREAEPIIALSTSVRNDSDATVSETLTYSYEKWTVGTWNNIAGITIGVMTEFEAGVPFVANAKFEISLTASYSHSWGGETGKKQTISSSTTVTVPPKKKARAQIIVRNAHIDVVFNYIQTILWADGSSTKDEHSGMYNNVDSWHVDVVLDNWEDV